MYQSTAKLACTASGMSFNEWMCRRIYRVHVKTFAIAQELCGLTLPAGTGMASLLHRPDASGLATFRALRPYRTCEAVVLRTRVAHAIKQQRTQRVVGKASAPIQDACSDPRFKAQIAALKATTDILKASFKQEEGEHVISYAYPSSELAVKHGHAKTGCYLLTAHGSSEPFSSLALAGDAASQLGTQPGFWSMDFHRESVHV